MWLVWISSVALAGSHCAAGERTVFTCDIGKKTASLCAESAEKPSWLQYRFGPVGNPELVFPEDRAGSVAKFRFEAPTAMHSGGREVSFENGGYRYVVGAWEPYHGGELAPPATSFVRVTKGEQTVASLTCDAYAPFDFEEWFGS